MANFVLTNGLGTLIKVQQGPRCPVENDAYVVETSSEEYIVLSLYCRDLSDLLILVARIGVQLRFPHCGFHRNQMPAGASIERT
jgi:hypothetical protein